MRISYQWLKDYLPVDLSPERVAEYLTNTGLEVEGQETLEAVPGGLKGVVVGQVLSCAPHPNADRLKVTKVDVGEGEALQIVCGAPNVAEGQKVVVATPGTELHGPQGSFKIKKSKLRGEVSNGMICAEDELGLGEDHDGIMVLDSEAPIGQPAAQYFQLEAETVFEIGLTPNRSDALGHYGVARDLRAALLRFDHPHLELSLPSVSAFYASSRDLPIKISIEAPEACFRYTGVSLKNVAVAPSPEWLQKRLRSIGLKPINNVVDVTNYVMHETGHPLHAFDVDRIGGREIRVKHLAEGTPVVALDESKLSLAAEDLAICDGDDQPLVLAGIMGGLNSGVRSETTQVFLEAAHFHPVSVRKSAKRHGLATDSSFRFERGVDPEMTLYALKRAALLIKELAGGEIAMEIAEEVRQLPQDREVTLDLKWLQAFIGQEMEVDLVRNILRWLDIRILGEFGDQWQLRVPAYRHDVERPADVAEEVLRIYGFNAIELPEKMLISRPTGGVERSEAWQESISQMLSARGLHEVLNNSLSPQDWLREEWGFDPAKAVSILNPLSQELNVMRQSLLGGGLQNLSYNRKRQQDRLAIYEFGRAYFRDGEGAYREESRLSLWLSGEAEEESWHRQSQPSNFYHLKALVVAVLEKMGFDDYREMPEESAPFAEALHLKRGKQCIATLGLLSKSLCQSFDLDQPVYFAELPWDLLCAQAQTRSTYRALPRFPHVRRDLALLVDESVRYADLKQTAFKKEKKLLQAVNLFDVYQGKNLPGGKKSYALSFILQDPEKTLVDTQVERTMANILAGLEKEHGAELR